MIKRKKVYEVVAKGSGLGMTCLVENEKRAVQEFCGKFFSEFYPPYFEYGKWCVRNSMTTIMLSVNEK